MHVVALQIVEQSLVVVMVGVGGGVNTYAIHYGSKKKKKKGIIRICFLGNEMQTEPTPVHGNKLHSITLYDTWHDSVIKL